MGVVVVGAETGEQPLLQLPVGVLSLLDLSKGRWDLGLQLQVAEEQAAELLVEAEVGVGVAAHHFLELLVDEVAGAFAAVGVLGCGGVVL